MREAGRQQRFVVVGAVWRMMVVVAVMPAPHLNGKKGAADEKHVCIARNDRD